MNCIYCWFGPLHSHDLPPSPPQPALTLFLLPPLPRFPLSVGTLPKSQMAELPVVTQPESPSPTDFSSRHHPPIALPSPATPCSAGVFFSSVGPPRVTSSRPGPESFHPEPLGKLALLKGQYFTHSYRIFRVSSVAQAEEVLSKQDHKPGRVHPLQ